MEAPQKTVDGHHRATHQRSRIGLWPLTSLDEGLYALACEEDVRCLDTLVRSFKLIEVYIKHGVIALNSYLRAPRFRATIEEITDEPGHVIDDVMRQLSFKETKLDGEAGFADVAGSGVEIFGLNVGRTQEPIMAEVSTEEPIVAEFSTQVTIVEEVGTQEFTVEDVSSEDANTDDEEEDFLVDEENKIIEPDVDVNLFSISMDLPFDNIGVTNLVPDDVLEGGNVDVINADGFNIDPGNDDETNYRRRRLAELSREMEGVINASGQWKVNPDIPVKAVQDQLQHDLEVHISMSKAFRSKAKPEREIRGDHRIYVYLGALKLSFRACRRDMLGLDGAFMKGPFLGQVLATVRLDSNNGIYPLAYALVELESIIPAIKTVFPSAEHRYCLRHIHENMKQGWCRQAYKDLLWRSASATSVKDFEKCMLELKKMNPKAQEWLNKIPPQHWDRSYFSGPQQNKGLRVLHHRSIAPDERTTSI
ncbi:hypothetical protein Tco_1282223 [Tanacetum coccineum]